jgi:hypothetical protein
MADARINCGLTDSERTPDQCQRLTFLVALSNTRIGLSVFRSHPSTCIVLLYYNWINAMSLQVIQQAVSGITQSQVFRVSITNVPAVVYRWITANLGQSALLITNGILIFTPAALTSPLLATMGFGASGPVAGE